MKLRAKRCQRFQLCWLFITVTEKPSVLWNHILYTRNVTDTAEAPLDPNIVTSQEQSWTNLKDVQKINLDFKSKYIQSGTVPDRPAYVEDYKVGVISGTLHFRFYKGIEQCRLYGCNIAKHDPYPYLPTTLYRRYSIVLNGFVL